MWQTVGFMALLFFAVIGLTIGVRFMIDWLGGK